MTRWILMGLCVLLMAIGRAGAQVDQGTIAGTVQDHGGAVIPNATVTLVDTDTGLILNGTSNGVGEYVFSPLKIGHYKVSATAPGFATTSQENLQLDVQQRLNIVLVLKPGGSVEQIVVSTAPPALQTEESSVGQVLSTETINNTPLNGRNWVFIAQLTSGVVPSAGMSRGSGSGDFFANGQRATQNNFILDGVDNNVNDIDFMNGASYNVRPPPDALSEFKVNTSNFSAEFGHSAGAVLNATIKSGTNEIHGSLWEYLRNTVLDAKNWNALTNPKYNQNQFGATLGFPLLKNHLFYFGDVEVNRIVIGVTTPQSVPTALMRQGNFSELMNPALTGAPAVQLYEPNDGNTTLTCMGQNNVFCPGQMSLTALNALSLYPMPDPGNPRTYNNNTATINQTNNTFQWDQRLDWNISAKDQTFIRYSYGHVQGTTPTSLGPLLANGQGSATTLSENVAFSETHIFNPKLVNEFRFGYNWGVFDNLQQGYNNPQLASSLGFGGVPEGPDSKDNGGPPYISATGMATFGDGASSPSLETQNVYQILDNGTKVIGNHSIRFGVNFQSVRMSFLQPTNPRGSYTYTGLYTSTLAASHTGYGVADFLADQMNSAALSNIATANDARWYRAGYVQDDWKATKNFTVNLGLRYDFFQPFKEMAGRQGNFVIQTAGVGTGTAIYQIPQKAMNVPLSPAFLALLVSNHVALQYVSNEYLASAQKTNVAPRVGFAYQMTPTLVVRGGFGLFFGGLESFGGRNLGANYPFEFRGTVSAPSCNAVTKICTSLAGADGITLENGLTPLISGGLQNFVSNPELLQTDQHMKTAYTMNYNFTVEKAITNSLIATASYVGNGSRHLEITVMPNGPAALVNPVNSILQVQAFPGLGQDDDQTFAGVSNYSGLQTKLEKHLSHGMNFLATYTWSHAMDDTATALSSTSQRDFLLIPVSEENTNSLWDVRHRFTFNGYYELPFGRGRAHALKGWLDEVAGGWATDLTFAAQTGHPFPQVTPNITTVSVGPNNVTRATLIRNPFTPGGAPNSTNPGVVCAAKTKTRTNWYNPCAFANPLPGNLISPGPGAGGSPYTPQAGYTYPMYVTGEANALAFTGGRGDTVYGPGNERVNMSVFKNFRTYRDQYLAFRVDIFNVFNHPSWGTPSIVTDNSNGGQITAPIAFQANTPDARFFQLSAKYEF